MQKIGRFFLYGVLFIFLVRNSIDIIREFIPKKETNNAISTQNTSHEVPNAAKNVAKVFVEKWFYFPSNANEVNSSQRQLELRALMTNNAIRKLSSGMGIRREETTQTPNVDPKQAQNQEKVNELIIEYSEIWDAQFTSPTKDTANILLRVELKDNRILFFSVPVAKAGPSPSSWLVDSPPALVPAPVTQPNLEKETTTDIEPEQQNVVQQMINDFLRAWLRGEIATVQRFTGGKELGSDKPVLENLESSQILEVKDFEVLSNNNNNPLLVSATVDVKDNYGFIISFTYQVSLTLNDQGNWIVNSIQYVQN